MEPSYKDLLLEILSIIQYREKEKFATEFEEMNRLEAMANSIERLPQHIQDEIVAKKGDPEEIKKYVPQDEHIEEITMVSSKALAEFLQHIAPVMTEEQKEKIAHVMLREQKDYL